MTFGTFCSGIGCPEYAWTKPPLNWQPIFCSEIEKFPSAVLAHHYPHTPNLGDMEKITEDELSQFNPDVLCAGTPCQSFSIAGLRGGMADARGNLALVFLKHVNTLRPKFVVWENVPGFLSVDGGNTARMFLDAFEELEYIVDLDILDAQFHGVPQRRRRIFICAQSVETLLVSKTDSSAITIAQCLTELSRLSLAAIQSQFENEPARSEHRNRYGDGIRRRMKLFGMQREDRLEMLQNNLEDWIRRLAPEQENSESVGEGEMDSSQTTEEKLLISDADQTEKWGGFLSIGRLWPSILAMISLARKLSTTSTAIRETTQSEIFTCSQVVLSIARLIALSNPSCPCFWSAASSALTAIREFTGYARSATSSLFTDMEWVQPWDDFVKQAESADDALSDIGIDNFGTILPISESLSGNYPPGRKTREGIAPTISARSKGGGGLGTDFDCDGGLIVNLERERVMPTLIEPVSECRRNGASGLRDGNFYTDDREFL